ncbi:MAG: aspartate/glutamate racemase family protein [Spirochaetaceae bacterium]|nr:aspartate/glutamate racemase family protein [Spirochaetaceae bacterium]MCF7948324.1 aspartate/glutamate racemase family protein [Spirochaetia bacterium]MCF7952336.1 aspartate/glutamate racemase family protein [Spirochaetaceae bacterium]
MLYHVKPGQVSYGEAIGILLLENYVPFVPGDTANATSYNYPVRFQRVPGFTVKRIMAHDMSLVDEIIAAALSLQAEGVRAITGDCGFMALYQDTIASKVDVPVFLSSLAQIPFMRTLLKPGGQIGIITANSKSLDSSVLSGVGITPGKDLVISGLESSPSFVGSIFEENGTIDTELIEAEVVEIANRLVEAHPNVKLLLLECSLLPPYGVAVQEATGLPVFDYITMIDYVYSAVVKKKFSGFM